MIKELSILITIFELNYTKSIIDLICIIVFFFC
jgi:hypothetical protein